MGLIKNSYKYNTIEKIMGNQRQYYLGFVDDVYVNFNHAKQNLIKLKKSLRKIINWTESFCTLYSLSNCSNIPLRRLSILFLITIFLIDSRNTIIVNNYYKIQN